MGKFLEQKWGQQRDPYYLRCRLHAVLFRNLLLVHQEALCALLDKG